MKFGIGTLVTDRSIRPAALGRAVEERGFDSLFVAEHTHIPVGLDIEHPRGGEIPEPYFRTLDPFVALGAAASVTDRILLGTGVALLPQRDPITTAKEVATLDVISGGRAAFGLGVGWIREETRSHGVDPATRGKVADERLRAIVELWTKEKAEYHGRFVDFGPVYQWPKPQTWPHPPIFVGGCGPASLRRVVEFGAAWLALDILPPDVMASMIGNLCQEAGTQVPVTVCILSGNTPEHVEPYARLDGVSRVVLYLPALPEHEGLAELDTLAELVRRYA
jgi:probable F420-dependent oxidoreductase